MNFLSKQLLLASLLGLAALQRANAQGCVAIRSTGGLCTMADHPDESGDEPSWLFNTNNRYYRSFRHFVGKAEQYQRIEKRTNVINHSYTQDLTLTRNFNSRWSAAIDIPVLANSRSSLYEHGGSQRALTHSFGLGDIRLTAYSWLLNPATSHKGNIQVGGGIKLPTGADDYQDYFSNVGPNGGKRLGPVDQSIQLGDGGTGITAEVNAYYNITPKLGFYGNFYYLINPRDVNGTSTARGGTASAASVAVTNDVMSVPDQYMIRGGLSLATGDFDFSAGVRDECLPAHDLVGGSDGFRRPGYIFSAEPGITYRKKKFSVYAYVPIAILRDRTQSVADIRTTNNTGIYTHGDAAFSDYSLNIGASFRF